MSLERFIHNIEETDLGVLISDKSYDQDAIAFLPNTARTLNYYKEEGLVPDRQKKSKFSFEELVWLRIVFDLKNIGINHSLIKQLKEYAFAPVQEEVLDEILEQNKDLFEEHVVPMLKQIPEEFHEEFAKALKEAMSDKKVIANKVKSNLRFWLMCIIQSKSAAEIHLFSDGKVEFHIKQIENNDTPSLQTYISISLTRILSFYLSKDYKENALTQKVLNKDELLVLQYIQEKKYKSIEITFKKEKIDLIKLAEEGQVDPAQRLYEFMLAGAYDDISIKREEGKIKSVSKITKIKPNIPPSIKPKK